MTWIRDGMVHWPDTPPVAVARTMDMAQVAGGDGAPARAFVRPHDGEA